MSQEDIERLVRERSLERRSFNVQQIAGFWGKAVASYEDARVSSISSAGRVQLAYTAALQATFAVLAAAGIRVKSSASHYIAFYTVQQLDDPMLRPFAVAFDEMRATRHQSIYEPDEDERELTAQLTEALQLLQRALPALRGWLAATRPDASGALAPLRG